VSYTVIRPPFTLKFREMSERELEDYRERFLGVLSARRGELQEAVRLSPGFESWTGDRSLPSLETLGHWLAGQVETRPRADDEIDMIKERGRFDILGFGRVPLNPVRIAVTFCQGIATGKQSGGRLKELYDYWSRSASAVEAN